ncbi:NAD(P)H-hydrate dehydratase [Desulfomicrobium escambiense]|uniref:NAD(P)H-hydrate dehydratase n=1 Tax=Desulfomicrobium escambiense TaxID=29503 RepID=UPI000426D6E3|nr:NAD(P)H-hydrate dehydratase [Desulfomicrobium escambiense]
MSWLIVGTVPRQDFGLAWGAYAVRGREIDMGGVSVGVARGTPALMATAHAAALVLGVEPPEALLVGDTGTGEGSRALYARLVGDVGLVRHAGVTFHYLMPDVVWHNRILWGLEGLAHRPLLVADAGFMYAAKMSGYASHYDLFTPDVGEMAFLADEAAPHPFYTRGFLLQEDERVPELIAAAHAGENAARHLLVKGQTDYVVACGRVVATLNEPDTPAMEHIGGTGDTLTGLVTALLASGMDVPESCRIAALTNRLLGLLADPTPACGVAELLPFLPKALERALR